MSNGTAEGTRLVKNINQLGDSAPSNLAEINGKLFFSAYAPFRGTELWISDGTESGTTLVMDIYAGASSSNPSDLINVNGTLFFRATDGTRGSELWKAELIDP